MTEELNRSVDWITDYNSVNLTPTGKQSHLQNEI